MFEQELLQLVFLLDRLPFFAPFTINIRPNDTAALGSEDKLH